MKATKLRENLFQILDRVIETGEPVEVERRGKSLRIVPVSKMTRGRLSKLIRRENAISGDPGDLPNVHWGDVWKPYL